MRAGSNSLRSHLPRRRWCSEKTWSPQYARRLNAKAGVIRCTSKSWPPPRDAAMSHRAARSRRPKLGFRERSARLGDEAAADVLIDAGQELAARAPVSAAGWFQAALYLTPERADNVERRLGLLAQRAGALGLAGRIEESRAALGEFLALSP